MSTGGKEENEENAAASFMKNDGSITMTDVAAVIRFDRDHDVSSDVYKM